VELALRALSDDLKVPGSSVTVRIVVTLASPAYLILMSPETNGN
jgi:hypothetical protein